MTSTSGVAAACRSEPKQPSPEGKGERNRTVRRKKRQGVSFRAAAGLLDLEAGHAAEVDSPLPGPAPFTKDARRRREVLHQLLHRTIA